MLERPLFDKVEVVLSYKGTPLAGRDRNPKGFWSGLDIIAIVCVYVERSP